VTATPHAHPHKLDVACYYHDPVKAPLLQAAVLPMADDLAATGLAIHAERHWLHGSHVRLRLAGPADAVQAAAEDATTRLRRYLARHPSTVAISAAQHLAMAAVAGPIELLPPPYEPIHPDNTVRIEAVDERPLADLLGSAAAVAYRADLLRLGLAPVAESMRFLSAHDQRAGARVRLALMVMARQAAAATQGFRSGHLTFLSHLDDFLLYHDPGGQFAARLAASWSRQGDAVTELVRAAVGLNPNGPATAALVAAWGTWTDEALAAAGAGYVERALPLQPGDEYTARARLTGDPVAARRWDPEKRTEYSDYHAAIRQVDFRRLKHEREFVTHRFCVNLLYQLLALCDVTAVERQAAAYLLVRAVQRITGVDSRGRLRLAVATGALPLVTDPAAATLAIPRGSDHE